MAVTRQASAVPLLALACLPADAAILPEDRADALYHSYDGGGVEVTGPSILVRKGDNKNFSVSANYYVDSISSASIDVVTQGSPYSEQRTQKSLGVDYLHGDTIMSIGYTNSDESDYKADTASFSISQSMFGDLTTVTLGYSRGWDDVMQNGNPTFDETVDRQQYRISLSQILTRSLVMAINYENVTEEGFLSNPYRSDRYLDGAAFVFEPENYPRTRTSNAVALDMKYFLPYRAALGLGYRYYSDDWDIDSHTAQIDYTHPLGERWIFELVGRYYTQSAAEFYSDLFPRQDAQNFRARDKELSRFTDFSFGVGVSYSLLEHAWSHIDRAELSLKYRRFWFDYDNFSDLTTSAPVGQEPAYEFTADVIQLYISAWY